MSEKTILVACSGLNPRGNVTRAAVNDIVNENENYDFACITTCGGGNQKHLDKTKNNKTIGVDGCQKQCTKKILENLGSKVDTSIDIKEILKNENLMPENPVRIGELEEKGVRRIKEEIYKVSENLN